MSGIFADSGQWDWQTDVMIVGGGGCGLTAALAAGQTGVKVTVVEKQAQPRSNTARSSGMIPAAGTRFQREAGVIETPEDFANDILNKNHHQSDPDMTLHMTRTAPHVVEWLVDECGVALQFVDDFTYPGHSAHRMHAPANRTGADFVADMRRAAEAMPNIDFCTDMPVQGLIADESGAVVGVVVWRGGANGPTERVRCGKVILATNGYGANPTMVRQYIPDMADALYFGSEGNTGEGILWGMELGAGTAYMDAYQAHNSVATKHHTLMTYALVTEGGFQVNKAGQRFGTEQQGYSERALEVLAQPGRVAYNIYDEKIHQFGMKFDYYLQAVDHDAVQGANTPEAIAARLSVDSDGLAATLDAFNAAARGHAPDAQGRTGLRVLEPPYYGVEVTGALFHTQGGLTVDFDGRVLREDGTPIANLYAGGGTAAGVSGHGAAGYLSGNGLLTALVYGMLAGQHAAQAVRG